MESSIARDLHSHYRDVRARLWGPRRAVLALPAPDRAPIEEPVPDAAPKATPLTVREVQRVVAETFQEGLWIMSSPSRPARHVHVRWVAMDLCRRIFGLSFPAIGRRFGNRDHTTVIHGVQNLPALIEADAEFRVKSAALRARSRSASGSSP